MDVSSCPVCSKDFSLKEIGPHVDRCLFLHDQTPSPEVVKRKRLSKNTKNACTPLFVVDAKIEDEINFKKNGEKNEIVPLPEKVRPKFLDQFSGQSHILKDGFFSTLLKNTGGILPSVIFWGPPGCGKTTLANIICKNMIADNRVLTVKVFGTSVNMQEIKQILEKAKNMRSFGKRTIVFVDEIHKLNKVQQDAFLADIESGVVTLIGATTENPSFSLNSALLSRSRVITLEKLKVQDIMVILNRAVCIIKEWMGDLDVETDALEWIARTCDGDARIALNTLEIASKMSNHIVLSEVRDSLQRSHIMYDKGEEHYNLISALHKSIRASDDNAAVYWLTRMLQGGEDPLYVARRFIRIASEDVGLADAAALPLAISALHAVQHIGMPECDVCLTHVAIYLARAPKSTQVYTALQHCKEFVNKTGTRPSVPLHLRNSISSLTQELGYGKGYKTQHKDKSGLNYLPDGYENTTFFE